MSVAQWRGAEEKIVGPAAVLMRSGDGQWKGTSFDKLQPLELLVVAQFFSFFFEAVTTNELCLTHIYHVIETYP